MKPGDPNLISFDARYSWQGPFNSPTLMELVLLGGFTIPLGIIGALWLPISSLQLVPKKSKKDHHDDKVLTDLSQIILPSLLTLLLFGLTVMTTRVMTLLAPFCAICAGYAMIRIFQISPKTRVVGIISSLVITAMIIINFSGWHFKAEKMDIYDPFAFRQVFSWMRNNTKPADAFVSEICFSPMILLNTGRPEVLHSKIENVEMQNRYKEYLQALYSEKEAELYNFCKKYKARYLVFSCILFTGDDIESERYKACRVPAISDKVNATRLFFTDLALNHFEIVYQNFYFSIFKVVEKRGKLFKNAFPYPPPQYSPEVFTKIGDSYYDTAYYFREFLNTCLSKINNAKNLYQSGNYQEIIQELEPLIKLSPHDSWMLYYYGSALVQSGDYSKAKNVLQNYLQYRYPEDFKEDHYSQLLLELQSDVLTKLKLKQFQP